MVIEIISDWELSVPPPTSSFAYPGSELTLWLLENCIIFLFFFLCVYQSNIFQGIANSTLKEEGNRKEASKETAQGM